MSQAFDPYHVWLGIRSEEQPANHYRLLGIQPFEDSPEAIENAADQRMAHLRSVQTGKHSALSQKVLNEVAAAKVCLLTPEKKAAYDAKLRERLESSAAHDETEQSPAWEAILPEEATDGTAPHLAGRRRGQSRNWQAGAVAGAVALLAVGVIAWMASRPAAERKTQKSELVLLCPNHEREGVKLRIDGVAAPVAELGPWQCPCEPGRRRVQVTRPGFAPFEQTVEVRAGESVSVGLVWQRAPGAEAHPTAVAAGRSAQPAAASPSDKPAPARPEKADTSVAQVSAKPAKDPAAGDEKPKAESKLFEGDDPKSLSKGLPPSPPTPLPQAGEGSLSAAPETAGPASPAEKEKPARLPVPLEAERQEFARQVRDAYKLDDAETAEAKTALAKQLLDLSGQSKGEPAERFVILRTAADLARDAGNPALLCQAIEALGEQFDVDTVAIEAKMLEKVIASANNAAAIKSAVEGVTAVADRAVAEDRYDVALGVLTTAGRLGQKRQGAAFRKEIHDRRAEVQKAATQWEQIHAALETLKGRPDDAEANLAAGRWYFFSKGEPERGLPYLAKGSDEALKKLAQQDLAAPEAAEEQVKLADAWFDLGQELSSAEKPGALARAGSWYEKAKPGLSAGLPTVRVEKRLEEIGKVAGAADKGGLRRTASGVAARDLKPGREFPRNKWVDVLKPADVTRDVTGQWMRNKEEVGAGPRPPALRCSVLVLPVAVQGDYDLEGQFTRVAGKDTVGFVCPVTTRQCDVSLSAFFGQYHSLGTFDGKGPDDPKNPTRLQPGILTNGRKYTLLAGVRLKGEDAAVDICLDGSPLIRWSGKQSSVNASSRWSPNLKSQPALMTIEPVIYHSARLRLLSGKAMLVAPPAVATR